MKLKIFIMALMVTACVTAGFGFWFSGVQPILDNPTDNPYYYIVKSRGIVAIIFTSLTFIVAVTGLVILFRTDKIERKEKKNGN